MSLSDPSSDGNIQYPALPGTLDNATENPNNSSVVSSQIQGLENNITGSGGTNNDATNDSNQSFTR